MVDQHSVGAEMVLSLARRIPSPSQNRPAGWMRATGAHVARTSSWRRRARVRRRVGAGRGSMQMSWSKVCAGPWGRVYAGALSNDQEKTVYLSAGLSRSAVVGLSRSSGV